MGDKISQLFVPDQILVLRFSSYSIFQKPSGFRLKSSAGMTECGGLLHLDIYEFVKRYTRKHPRHEVGNHSHRPLAHHLISGLTHSGLVPSQIEKIPHAGQIQFQPHSAQVIPNRKEVEVIRFRVFPFIPIAIIAALALLFDRSMEYSLIQKEATLAVIIMSLLTLPVLVLPIYLQRKHRSRKGGPYKSDE